MDSIKNWENFYLFIYIFTIKKILKLQLISANLVLGDLYSILQHLYHTFTRVSRCLRSDNIIQREYMKNTYEVLFSCYFLSNSILKYYFITLSQRLITILILILRICLFVSLICQPNVYVFFAQNFLFYFIFTLLLQFNANKF